MIPLLFALSLNAWASDSCQDAYNSVVERRQAEAPAHLETIGKMNSAPADLGFIEKDPSAYFKKVEKLFDEQKKLHPERPYGFGMEDLAPTLSFIKSSLAERLSHYELGKGVIWRKADQKWLKVFEKLGMRGVLKRYYEDARAERELLKELIVRAEQMDPVKPAYDELLNLSYFAMRAQSLSTDLKQPWRTFIQDMAQDTTLSRATRELASFRNSDPAFKPRITKFNRSYIYTRNRNLLNPDQLDMVLLPVVGSLDAHPFIQLRGVPVYLTSVINGQLRADGWVLNEIEVLTHDVYFHAGMMQEGSDAFLKTHPISRELLDRLRDREQVWYQEFIKQQEAIEDPKLRAAVLDVALTVVHDRGPTFYPDTFTKWNEGHRNIFNSISISRIYYKLMGQLMNTGISDNLLENIRYSDEAVRWLDRFWKQDQFMKDPVYLEVQSHKIESPIQP